MEVELPKWARFPLLGLYAAVFGCDLKEAMVTDLSEYSSFKELFVRRLKAGARKIDSLHCMVCVYVISGTIYNVVYKGINSSHTNCI